MKRLNLSKMDLVVLKLAIETFEKSLDNKDELTTYAIQDVKIKLGE